MHLISTQLILGIFASSDSCIHPHHYLLYLHAVHTPQFIPRIASCLEHTYSSCSGCISSISVTYTLLLGLLSLATAPFRHNLIQLCWPTRQRAILETPIILSALCVQCPPIERLKRVEVRESLGERTCSVTSSVLIRRSACSASFCRATSSTSSVLRRRIASLLFSPRP